MARRRVWLGLATVALGIAAHVLGGGDTDLSCAPLIGAALVGVVTTFLADRGMGYRRSCGPGAVALVGTGQLVMHVELSGALVGHASPGDLGLGLTCGLVIAHACATGVIVSMLLGVQRALELPLELATRASAWLWAFVLPLVTVDDDEPTFGTAILDGDLTAAVRRQRYGSTHRRRGPPIVVAATA